MKEAIESIQNKINSMDFNFTTLEKDYIKLMQELSTLLLEKLGSEEVVWTPELYSFVSNRIVGDIAMTDDFIFQYAKATLDFRDDIEFYLDELFEYVTEPERVKVLEEKVKNKKRKIDFNCQITEGDLLEFLDNKEYDKFFKVKNIVIINASTPQESVLIQRMSKEFPYEQYGVPNIFGDKIQLFADKVVYMDLSTLLTFIGSIKQHKLLKGIYPENVNEFIYDQVKLSLKRFLLDPEQIKSIESIQNPYHILRNYLSEEDLQELSKYIKENHNYLFELPGTSHRETLSLAEELKTNELAYQTFRHNIINNNFMMPDYAKTEIFDVFYDRKDFGILFYYYDEHDQNPYMEKIIELIKAHDEDIIKFIKENYGNIQMNNEVYLCILKENIFDVIHIDYRYKYNSEVRDEINRLMIEKPDAPLDLPENIAFDIDEESFYIALIKSNRIEMFHSNFIQHVYDMSYFSDELINLICEKINTSYDFASNICESYSSDIIKDGRILDSLLSRNDLCTLKVISQINHDEELTYLYNQDTYESTKKFICEFYGFDPIKLDFLTEKVGYEIIRYYENENIKDILELSIEEIQKILDIFETSEYTMIDVAAAHDTIKQYYFSVNNRDIINIFPNILHSIEDGNLEYEKYIDEIYPILDEKFYKRFNEKYSMEEKYQKDPKLLLEFIIAKIKLKNDKEQKYIDILHEITDYYIEKKREEYRTTYNIEEELDIPYIPELKTTINYLIENFIKTNPEIKIGEQDLTWDEIYELRNQGFFGVSTKPIISPFCTELIRILVEKGYEESLITDVINYLRNPETTIVNDKKAVIKGIKVVKDTARELISTHLDTISKDNIEIIEQGIKEGKIKKEYQVPQRPIYLLDVITKLRLDIIKDKLLTKDNKEYLSLIKCMKKRKLHLIPDFIKDFIEGLDMDFKYDFDGIIQFVNYYYKIYEKEERTLRSNGKNTDDILPTLPSALKNAEVLSSLSSIYAQVLGEEDARLIAANDGPNQATSKLRDNGRLKEALEWTIKNFKRDKVTIPSFTKTIEQNGKRMNCIVGNFTHPSNLTHGERTGACMRIGGVGETLFSFALNNENGFHIRFENPETGKYVSRVTGFRNGNTVFLNELRYSCDPDNYNDPEIVEFCREVAKELIERSKDSSCPINNVVIHRAYATEKMEDKEQNLGVKNIKQGLPGFYTDVSSNAIVLATSKEDGSLVPLNFDKKNVPTYRPCREKIIASSKRNEMLSIINRVHAINVYLQTESFSNIDTIEFSNGFVYGIANQDWYIYLDENFELHEEIINIDNRALIELEEARATIKNMLESLQEEKGVKHGI